MGYFNIKQDIEIERAGGFFCESCIACYPLEKQSPDPRYCQQCYNIFKEEREPINLIAEKPVEEMPPKRLEAPQEKPEPVTKRKPIPNPMVKKITEKSDTVKGGEKKAIFDKVKRLTLQGKSSRAIAAILEKDGKTISHMTISRMQKKIRQGILF